MIIAIPYINVYRNKQNNRPLTLKICLVVRTHVYKFDGFILTFITIDSPDYFFGGAMFFLRAGYTLTTGQTGLIYTFSFVSVTNYKKYY